MTYLVDLALILVFAFPLYAIAGMLWYILYNHRQQTRRWDEEQDSRKEWRDDSKHRTMWDE